MIVVVTGSNKGTGITVSSSSGGVPVIPSPDPIVLGNQPNPVQINPDITGLTASEVALDTTNFDNNLDATITDVQLLADAVDELTTSAVAGTMLPTNYIGSILLDLQSGRDYGMVEVTSDLVVGADGTGIINGASAQIGFIGNGTNTLDLTAFNQLDTGTGALTFDNTLNTLNAFAFIRWLNRSYWNLLSQYTYTGPVTLSAPGSFAANSTTVSSITLTWTTAANASNYMLEWSANGTTGWAQIGGTISQVTATYNHTTLTSGVQYFYRISSIGDGVNYLTSGYATANDTVNTPVTLSAPSVSPAQLDSNTARFTITPVANASGYRYRYGTSTGSYGAENNTGATTVDIDATTGQTVYAIFMTIGDGVNYLNSAYGAEVSQLLTANQAPVASSVNITGSVTLGATLTGNYTYADNEGDLQGTSTFRWLRNDVAISGATNSTYVITIPDQGTTIKFEVTPVAQTGTTPGIAVSSVGTSIPAAGSPESDITGSLNGMTQSGTIYTPTTTPAAFKQFNSVETFAGDFELIFDMGESFVSGYGRSFGIDVDNNFENGYAQWVLGVFQNGANVLDITIASASQGSLSDIQNTDRIKFKRVGSTVTLEKYRTSWATVYTYTGTFSATYRFKFATYSDTTVQPKLYNPKYIGTPL